MARPLAERLWEKVDRRGPDECWPWRGYIHDEGYGRLWLGGDPSRLIYAHRAALLVSGRDLPEGMVVDHQCHNQDESCPGGPTCRHRRCCNPAHLVLTRDGPNVLRGRGPSARGARATHCPKGHAYSEENTRYDYRGWRYCRACQRIANANRRRK